MPEQSDFAASIGAVAAATPASRAVLIVFSSGDAPARDLLFSNASAGHLAAVLKLMVARLESGDLSPSAAFDVPWTPRAR